MISAVLLVFGLLLGLAGTYLMTSAYHPFSQLELFGNFLQVLWRFSTFQWPSARRVVRAVARAGEKLNQENKALSLMGIYFLFLSFVVQLISAAFAIWDLCHKTTP
jgi:hypothetical protein